ncbi:glycosyltransferase family 4 protein [Roseibium sp. MMSF_3412]|uniref:glycosyltransferase family 4 protein n=1 Tax=Roseibium sp. MMSF_3412 TaxID=3046712 RepID=UPI00273DC598|nr:glycosyltransferase family 4 protein [Roseibium sp. MMSF_3412]
MSIRIPSNNSPNRIDQMDATGQRDNVECVPPAFSGTSVVHVVRQFSPSIGGLEDVVKNLALQQKNRFADVKVVTLDRVFTDPATRLPGHDVVDGIEVVRIPYRGSSRYPVAPSVLNEITGADLVHVHAIDFFYDFLAFARPFHRKTLVATSHGGFFHTRKFARLKTVWFNTLTRLSTRQYSALACCSGSDLELFSNIAPAKTSLIENGVDIGKFMNAGAKQPVKRLLTLGRFSSNKRLERLMDVMANLVASDPEWHLDVAGMESDLTGAELLAMSEARGLSKNIDIHVGLGETELKTLFARSSFFASASEYEGFGLVLIEAMSAGLLPVVEANEAFGAVARKHEIVRTVDFADSGMATEALRSRFTALQQQPALRNDAIAAARGYSWPAKAREYEDLYRKVLRF